MCPARRKSTAQSPGVIVLQNLKQAIATTAGAASLALLLLAGLIIVIIPAGLTLLVMAYSEARRKLYHACAQWFGRNSPAQSETR